MKLNEHTPLVNKKQQQQSIRKFSAYALTLATVLIIAGSVYYLSSSNEATSTSVNSSFSVRDVKERKEVSINLLPDDIYHLEVLNTFHTDEEWMDYHSQIIQREGYDTSDDDNLYAFTMFDYKYDKAHYFAKYGFDDTMFANLDDPIEADHHGQDFEHGTDGHHDHDITTPHPTRPIMGRTGRPTQTPRPTYQPKKEREHTREPRPTTYRSPRPTRDAQTSDILSVGGMICYFRYSLLESKNTADHVLRCNDDGAIMVGCVGGSTQRPKPMRSGELASDDGCVVNGEAIYIRCCKLDAMHDHHTMTGKVSDVSYEYNDEYPTYQINDYCQSTDLDGFDSNIQSYHDTGIDHDHDTTNVPTNTDRTREEDHSDGDENWVMTGCTAWAGTEEQFESSQGTARNTMAQNIIGAKIVKNGFTGATNCKAHRGDKGFIAASAIAVKMDKWAEMDCVTVESGKARIPSKIDLRKISNNDTTPIWGSMDFCPEGYNLMDCTGYNEATMKDCSRGTTRDDRVSSVVYHGADLKCMTDKGAHCSSMGYTKEIRVQATCCKINMLHEEKEESNYYYINDDDE